MNGISLSQSSRNTLTGNRIVNSSVNGIDLSYSDNNTVSQNTISGNACGITVFRSSLNKINMNNVSSNSGKGIQLWSSYNEIYLNNFMDNDPNADTYSSPVNNWSSTSRLCYTYYGKNLTNYLGNYWDDYQGPDTDADGIGDTFYEITGDRDEYPLMQPIGEEGFEIWMKEDSRVDFIYLLAFYLCCLIAKRLTPRRLAQDHGTYGVPEIVLGFLRSR
jgi:parallel beta-helix repeat protein